MPGSTKAAHPGCLQGTFGLYGIRLSFLEIRKAGWVFHHLGSVLVPLLLLLPGEICLAKVAVGTHAVVVDIEKSQAVDDALRSKVVGISDILFDETLQVHALAYNIFNWFRRLALSANMRKQRIDTVRLKLLKIAAKVIRSARYTTFKLCSSCPYKSEFYETLSNIGRLNVQLE